MPNRPDFDRSQRRNSSRTEGDQPMSRRNDDYFYGAERTQRDDWSSRAYDNNAYDRREGQYYAGGRDFSERMSDAYGFDPTADRAWYGRGGGWNDQSGFEPQRGWRERRGAAGEGHGIMESVKSFFGVGPKNYRRSDERIREDVCESLSRHHEIDASDIEVQVKNGEVILTGTVENRWMKRQAEDVVEAVSGVKDVRVELTIPRNTDSTGEVRSASSGARMSSADANMARQGNGRSRKVQ